jgi:hypothetical protein
MTRRRGIGQSPDGRPRRPFAILGRMISFGLIVIGAIAVVIGALLRPILGRWMDKRNIERLGRRYNLDPATADQLYRLARRVGFGSAWQTLIEGRADATGQTSETSPARRPRAAARTRRSSLAERNRA